MKDVIPTLCTIAGLLAIWLGTVWFFKLIYDPMKELDAAHRS